MQASWSCSLSLGPTSLLTYMHPGWPLAVWLINYRHFLSWKPYPGSWIPDPSTIQFSVGKATFYFKVCGAAGRAAQGDWR